VELHYNRHIMTKLIMKTAPVGLLCLGLVIAGCAGVATGRFDTTGFHDHTQNYTLAFVSEGSTSFVSDSWELENWQATEDGGFTSRPGAEYESEYILRWETRRPTTVGYRRYDVRLQNTNDQSLMWTSTVPLDGLNAERPLSDLLTDFLSSQELSLVPAIEGATGDHTVQGGAAAMLQGQEGFAATLMSEGQPVGRIALVRLPSSGRVFVASHSGARGYADVPLLIVVGYLAQPANYPTHIQDFGQFADAIRFNEGGGETRGIAPAAPAPTPQPEPAPQAMPEPEPETMNAPVLPAPAGDDAAPIADTATPASEESPEEEAPAMVTDTPAQ
jgi:hypothetical protein